jgi:HK97 family phage portal protein
VALFNLISKRQAAKAMIPLVKAVQQLSLQRSFNTGGFPVYGYGNVNDQIAAYASVDDLYAVVNRIMKTASLIPLYSYNIVNKKSYSQFKLELKKYVKNPSNKRLYELIKLQNKAMELAGEDDELQLRLDNPNTFQSKTEFYQLTYTFKLLAGNYYIFKDLLNAGANEGKIFEMYNLPPNFTFPIPTGEVPRRANGYKFTLYNQNKFYEKEEIIHGKYANPVFDFSGNELVGLSPLQAGSKTLTTIANETDYQNQSLKNAGAGGVMVSEDAGQLSPESLGQMKDDVLAELGAAWQGNSNVNANKLGFLAGKWNYLKVFIDPINMQLLDQKKMTFKRLCNIYGVSDKLFNNDDGAKYDNYDVALKELYTNAALPLVSALADDFNMGLVPHYGERVVGYDISDIPELNENQADIVQKYSNAPGFKPNDLRESLGYGRDLGPDGEKFVIKTGYTLLEDLVNGIDIPLDNNNDYTPNS